LVFTLNDIGFLNVRVTRTNFEENNTGWWRIDCRLASIKAQRQHANMDIHQEMIVGR
jgi:hypothetical protein